LRSNGRKPTQASNCCCAFAQHARLITIGAIAQRPQNAAARNCGVFIGVRISTDGFILSPKIGQLSNNDCNNGREFTHI